MQATVPSGKKTYFMAIERATLVQSSPDLTTKYRLQKPDLTNVASKWSFAGVDSLVNNEAISAAEHPGTVKALELEERAGATFTTLHFLDNLQMGVITSSVCPSQAFTSKCNVTL
jgi:hypothetical protein